MAGSTLSFFTRLFSSKKKKILEKRGEEEFKREAETEDHQDINALHQRSENTSSQSPHPPEARSAGQDSTISRFQENISGEEETFSDQSYISHEQPQQNYSEEVNPAVAAVSSLDSEQLGSEGIGASSLNYGEQTLNQENTESESYDASGDTSHDDALEYDSMVLLSKLEQLMIRLSLTVRPFLRRFSRNHLQTHIDLCREA